MIENPKNWHYKLGDKVWKISGSSWRGTVVGFYSSSMTPHGYVVESDNEPGSCQLYPGKALAKSRDSQ